MDQESCAVLHLQSLMDRFSLDTMQEFTSGIPPALERRALKWIHTYAAELLARRPAVLVFEDKAYLRELVDSIEFWDSLAVNGYSVSYQDVEPVHRRRYLVEAALEKAIVNRLFRLNTFDVNAVHTPFELEQALEMVLDSCLRSDWKQCKPRKAPPPRLSSILPPSKPVAFTPSRPSPRRPVKRRPTLATISEVEVEEYHIEYARDWDLYSDQSSDSGHSDDSL